MQRLLYYLLVWPLSQLPLPVLYGLSDLLYLIGYRLVGYRIRVVRQNLRSAFPQKSSAERRQIERRFYHHFFDLIVESIRMFSMSEDEGQRRARLENPEVLTPHFEAGRHIALVLGHYGNWELYGLTLARPLLHQPVAIYHAPKSSFYQQLLLKSRSRFGVVMRSTTELKAIFYPHYDRPCLTAFLADQSPSSPRHSYWLEFLNQDTPVFYGVEKWARLNDAPVYFAHIKKQRRGYYSCHFSLVSDQPNEEPEGAITERFTHALEADIRREPAYWFWTHRRWKRERVPGREQTGTF